MNPSSPPETCNPRLASWNRHVARRNHALVGAFLGLTIEMDQLAIRCGSCSAPDRRLAVKGLRSGWYAAGAGAVRRQRTLTAPIRCPSLSAPRRRSLTFLGPARRAGHFYAPSYPAAIVLWRAIALTYRIIKEQNERRDRSDLDPALVLMTRLARILLAIVFMVLVLSYFGINVAALSAAVGLGGLAISLAARDTIADAIAGVIILLDRPFRIGDRIEIERANTWGDVTEIGLRTTRIRTRDNRLVVPNSISLEPDYRSPPVLATGSRHGGHCLPHGHRMGSPDYD
jgi:hypothetical protein